MERQKLIEQKHQSTKASDGEEWEERGAGDWLMSDTERLGIKFWIPVQSHAHDSYLFSLVGT